jgi:hypothetical protein
MRLDHREQQYLHQHSIRYRSAVELSEICGCFYCQSVFPQKEITEWIDGWPSERCAFASAVLDKKD